MTLEALRPAPEGDRPPPDNQAATTLPDKPILSLGADTPPFQVMPPLTADEYAALREDIQANGVLVPITVDQHGTIIDGHHRQQIAHELGIPCPRIVQEFATDQKRHNAALGLNLKRRHLTREQFRELIATESERTPDASDREIARRLGCSHRTVAAVRRPPEVDKLPTPPGLIPPTTPAEGWQVQIPATIEEAVDHLNALAEWQEQVDKLSTPKLTRGEAEVLTEAIRRGLADADQLCNELLAGGVPRANVTTLLLEAWARFREEFTDAEITDGMWTYMIAPRVEAIANWQPANNGGAT